MLSYRSKDLNLHKALLTTSAAVALLACANGVAWAQDAATTPTASNTSNQTKTQADNAVSEVVVTGTNIRGVKPIDPVITITRQDIDASGYATIGDVMRSLPEDFAGGQNPGNFGVSGINNENTSDGSSVNLFGLGSDATLTLINGHRMPGDGFYDAPDISVIPLGAIQRVEVVTDGSSAIYGSDAVAGVVNFILRKDYNGLEASAYYGGATEGGDETQIYSMLGGVATDRWHVLLSAQYEHEDPITASERAFTSGEYGPTTLIEAQTQKSLFLSGGADITDKISFSLDGFYNIRDSGGVYGENGVYNEDEQYESPNYNVAATLDFKLPRNWDLSLVGTKAESSTADTYQEAYRAELIKAGGAYRNDVSSVELTGSGRVITLPTGDLRIAVGGGYREEGFKQDYPGMPADDIDVVRGSRDVAYAYGEALLPLVPASANRLGLEELELSTSGRYERYSDFGDTANPKVGLRYVPVRGLTIRGSWGTSFKAPSLLQEHQASEVLYVPISDFGSKIEGNGLLTYGGNPDLKPERSKNWTIGADYSPTKLSTMLLSVTYFNIDYTDRIVQPLTPSYLDALTNPVNAPFVIIDPSAAVQQSTISAAAAGEFYNEVGTPYQSSTVGAIALDEYQNAISQVDTGVDASYRQSFVLGIGNLRTFASATWSHLTEQLTTAAPVQTLSGTIFNVPTFRTRGGASWSNYGLTATAIVNYTSSEKDTLVTPNTTVASLTTVDVNLAYKFPDSSGLRHGLALTISATNLFDKAPPYANGPNELTQGIYFDGLNASAIGRFVAFKVTKKW